MTARARRQFEGVVPVETGDVLIAGDLADAHDANSNARHGLVPLMALRMCRGHGLQQPNCKH
jgi:hypothetical protein